MSYPEELLTLFDELIDYCEIQKNIEAILLVGSYAYGGFKADSDIDLVIISNSPKEFLDDTQWINKFGILQESSIENYGPLDSIRAKYTDKEVEFGITTPDWANIDPLDAGTKEVIKAGAKIIYDPNKLLKNLLEKMY